MHEKEKDISILLHLNTPSQLSVISFYIILLIC